MLIRSSRPAPRQAPVLAARPLVLLAALAGALPATLPAQERQVYRCPGNLYTDQITAREAQERGCKTLSGAPVTVVQSQTRRPTAGAGPVASAAAGRPEVRVDPAEQRARDTDARRILEGELRKEEERLAQARRELAEGEAQRRGDERNYARYQERVAELKAAVARKEADVAAIRRELAKLPGTP
ncbi:MAG: hypothetical protein L6Q75_09275 [Burkholderiaceae bacterium]|nr:hypothetical protein [Burkholderiaceae bacterium]